jgi:hypothetical protein
MIRKYILETTNGGSRLSYQDKWDTASPFGGLEDGDPYTCTKKEIDKQSTVFKRNSLPHSI